MPCWMLLYMIWTKLSRSGLVCSCQNLSINKRLKLKHRWQVMQNKLTHPITWPYSCAAIPTLSHSRPNDTFCAPFATTLPTIEQQLLNSNYQDNSYTMLTPKPLKSYYPHSCSKIFIQLVWACVRSTNRMQLWDSHIRMALMNVITKSSFGQHRKMSSPFGTSGSYQSRYTFVIFWYLKRYNAILPQSFLDRRGRSFRPLRGRSIPYSTLALRYTKSLVFGQLGCSINFRK